MIRLQFHQGFTPSIQPVRLRFEQAEPLPAWPVILPNLGSAFCTLFRTSGLALAAQLPVQNRSLSAAIMQRSSAWMLSDAWQSSFASKPCVAANQLTYHIQFENQAVILAQAASVAARIGNGITWAVPVESAAPCALATGSVAIGQAVAFDHWPQSPVSREWQLNWRRTWSQRYVALPYGPAPAKWVCSGNYPLARGRATLRFKVSTPQLRIDFDPPPQHCSWDEGGGYKNAHDVLPVIDFVVPIEPLWRRSYVMQPTITCMRLSDGQTIAVSSISISKRRGNFAKAVSVSFQSKIDMERARNQPLQVMINGYEHRVLIEQCSRAVSFGVANYQGQGRSLVAMLAAPYRLAVTYANPTARSLLGVLSDLLEGSGWTAVAQVFTDFTIPAGAFSVQGKAPIEAIAAQLDGLGLMLSANDTTKELTLLPKWPVVPWHMANQNPAIVFHEGVIQSLSESEELSPLCNGVYVRGEQVGVSAHVKRQGTAGNVTPNDISHPLIVTSVAAQLCGTAALADTGKKRQWQITAPVMATLPIVTEGQLIGIRNELGSLHIAMVDSWSVTASISADGAVSVKQSFTALEPLEV